jgi:hypothetical protein
LIATLRSRREARTLDFTSVHEAIARVAMTDRAVA